MISSFSLFQYLTYRRLPIKRCIKDACPDVTPGNHLAHWPGQKVNIGSLLKPIEPNYNDFFQFLNFIQNVSCRFELTMFSIWRHWKFAHAPCIIFSLHFIFNFLKLNCYVYYASIVVSSSRGTCICSWVVTFDS